MEFQVYKAVCKARHPVLPRASSLVRAPTAPLLSMLPFFLFPLQSWSSLKDVPTKIKRQYFVCVRVCDHN